MRFVHAPVILAIALVLGACTHVTSSYSTSGSPGWVNAPQPIEPEAVEPALAPASNDLVVLLPKANGSVGAVVVRSGGSDAVVLDKPYAAARIDGAGRVESFTYDADLAKQAFTTSLTALPVRPVTFLLYFLEGKDELTPDSEREVERVFAEIAARPDPEISVIGHADAVGTTEYNDQLSLQRARRVREDLTRRGIPGKDIEVAGRGKREPIVGTAADTAEPRNRRVEIVVR
jgi:outer membrane protein OmpA-like peptidoglycan-associated protein